MHPIKMTRTFHPVGQGAFYTEVFDYPGGDQKVIVYDCGTETGKLAFKKAGGTNLNDQIKDFANKEVAGNKHIDYLFISHFHDDHINGLSDLTQKLKPNCIVIPMLPMDMILTTRICNFIAYGQNALLSDELIQDLFLGNNPQRDVIAVRPDVGDRDNTPLYPQGNHHVEESIELLDNKGAFWRYRLFNSVNLNDVRAKNFINDVRNIPGLLNGDVLDVQQVLNHIDDLKDLYKKAMNEANDNLYTLVVESEPLRVTITEDKSLAGCVYFGDFVPSKNVWGRFLQVINDYENVVGAIQVPHHGAEANWRSEMLTRGIENHSHFVFSSGSKNKYHHPYYWIIDEVQRSKKLAHVVSEYPASEFSLTYFI